LEGGDADAAATKSKGNEGAVLALTQGRNRAVAHITGPQITAHPAALIEQLHRQIPHRQVLGFGINRHGFTDALALRADGARRELHGRHRNHFAQTELERLAIGTDVCDREVLVHLPVVVLGGGNPAPPRRVGFEPIRPGAAQGVASNHVGGARWH